MIRDDLSKEVIIKGRNAFKRLFEHGMYKQGRDVSIIYMSSDSFKIGFAVSKKIRGSVRRNRLKRLMREVYRTHKALFPDNMDVILLAKREDVRFEDLKSDICSLLDELIKP